MKQKSTVFSGVSKKSPFQALYTRHYLTTITRRQASHPDLSLNGRQNVCLCPLSLCNNAITCSFTPAVKSDWYCDRGDMYLLFIMNSAMDRTHTHKWNPHTFMCGWYRILNKKSRNKRWKGLWQKYRDLLCDVLHCFYLHPHPRCQSASYRKASALSCSICRGRLGRWVAAGLLPALLPAPRYTWALLRMTHTDQKYIKNCWKALVSCLMNVQKQAINSFCNWRDSYVIFSLLCACQTFGMRPL